MFCIDNLKNGKFHQHLRDIFAPQVKKLQKNRAWQTTQLWRQRDNCGGNLPQFSGQRKCCLSEILCRLFTWLRCANICHTLACPMEALILCRVVATSIVASPALKIIIKCGWYIVVKCTCSILVYYILMVRYMDLMESSVVQFISSSLCLCIRWCGMWTSWSPDCPVVPSSYLLVSVMHKVVISSLFLHQVVQNVNLMESKITQFISSSLCLCIRWCSMWTWWSPVLLSSYFLVSVYASGGAVCGPDGVQYCPVHTQGLWKGTLGD